MIDSQCKTMHSTHTKLSLDAQWERAGGGKAPPSASSHRNWRASIERRDVDNPECLSVSIAGDQLTPTSRR